MNILLKVLFFILFFSNLKKNLSAQYSNKV